MAEVTLQDVEKVYHTGDDDFTAVTDLDLDIEDGEFLVLVGPSGCGKSSTLRMIAGLESITEGTISIGEKIVNEKKPKERDIAMVFQNYALYPHKSVRQNIGFGLKYSSDLSDEEIDSAVTETAEMMGISELLDEKPGQLSGGQKQRVALGRAIVRDPSAFLLDEPLSNLDAKLRTHMRTEITKLQSRLGVTTIYVTHDQAEAMTMGDRIAVLNEGRLQQIGTPNEVYDHPANKFVAGFIGSPSMNFMDMQVDERGGETVLVAAHDDSRTLTVGTLEPSLSLSNGDTVTLGVRPEDLTIANRTNGVAGNKRLGATVTVLEPMGSDNYISLDVGRDTDDGWVARVDSNYTPEPGTELEVAFSTESMSLFTEDGTTIKSQGTHSASFHRAAPTATD